MILLTTSRRPTRGIRTFCHDFGRSVPNIVRINRGKLSITEVAEKALEENAEKVIIVDRWKDGPGKLRFFNVNSTGLNAVPPLIYISGIKLSEDLRKAKVKPSSGRSLVLALLSERSDQAFMMAKFLSNFLRISILSIEQASLNRQTAMLISFDSAQRMQITFISLPEKVEVGPSITVSHVIWEI